MNKAKIFTILFFVMVTVCLLFFVMKIILLGGTIFLRINYESISKIFEKDKDKIFVVSNYLEKSAHENIYIPFAMQEELMSINGVEECIHETDVIQTIKMLKNKGYSVIGKNGNTIFFQRWSNLDGGRGIAYSIDGKKPQLEYLTALKPLLEEDWYYYEEDCNIWMNNNYTNGIPNYLLGEWKLRYAKRRGTGKEYPLEELYSKEVLDNGVKIIFNSDGTFIRTVGNTLAEDVTTEGTYILRSENKILLKHRDGKQSTAQYLMETGEFVYYTYDIHMNPINEYYCDY